MKVSSRCGFCLFYRGYREIERSTRDEEIRYEAVRSLLELMCKEFHRDVVPSNLGSMRDRLIKRVTGCRDPYSDLKRLANSEALKMLPRLEAFIESQPPFERFRTACKIACLGNIIEYDVPGHSHDVGEVLKRLDAEAFFIDDTDGFKALLRPGMKVMLLADNAGEIVFDRLIVRELKSLGGKVIVVVKGGPALNDAMIEDAEESGILSDADEVISTGTDAIGVNLSESSPMFLEAFSSSEAIVSKGMANWETLTEIEAPCPILFIFRTKCEPVANSLGVPQEKNIAKLVLKGWRL
ncbi:MAG: damage-control phosphatase ARMT1 family protein [Candidatus Bathyarchaeia archaeon]